MATATMTSKGQVTIPKDVRDLLGLKAGDRVSFVVLGDRRAAIVPRNRGVEKLFGILHNPDIPPVSIEQMNDDIAEAAAEGSESDAR